MPDSIKYGFVLLLAHLVLSYSGGATHIVGGDLSYRCVGNDRYDITLQIYRDCKNGEAWFDDPAFLTVRHQNGVFLRLEMPLVDTAYIPSDIYDPCFEVPSGVCVEQGTYRLSNIHLPSSNGGYTLAYQRCCRNNTVKNINNPGDVGTTISGVIPPPGQAICNSSPVFRNLPPLAICLASEFEFDHSAFDPDGDSLSYEFCSPFVGGGRNNSFGGPLSPRPDTATAPPYTPVSWAPGYSAANPLDANPAFQIDPATGLISGSPRQMGQYVFAICVTEWRNGVAINVTRREYQINIRPCQSNTAANFQVPDPCSGLTATLSNTSTTSRTFLWDFGVAGLNSDTSLARNPSYTFPDTGTYKVRLIVNRQFRCADTIEKTIQLWPPLNVSIKEPGGACITDPVFDFYSDGTVQPYTKYEWTFESSEQVGSRLKDPRRITFNDTGYHKVSLTASHGACSSSWEEEVMVAPLPNLKYAIRANDGCAPLRLQLEDYSTAWTPIYRLWYVDNEIFTDSIIQLSYTQPGEYDVALSVFTKTGCIDTIPPQTKTIQVSPSPVAGFSLSQTEMSIFDPEVHMRNLSKGAKECFAWFGAEYETSNCNDVYQFEEPGIYRISQLVTNEFGCTDTSSKLIRIQNEYAFFAPNSFTPNNDGSNELFKPIVIGARTYELEVLDRWGKVIFLTNDPAEGWDGTNRVTGDPVQNGTYLYKARVKTFLDEYKDYTGNLYLIR